MTHQYVVVTDDGEQPYEFHCPVYGRWLLVYFWPFSPSVIEAGDEMAEHAGGIGGLMMSGMEIVLGES